MSRAVGLAGGRVAACLSVLVALWSTGAMACTCLLVARGATADGSTFVTYSCDGGIFAAVRIEDEAVHPPDSVTTLLDDPSFFESAQEEPAVIGSLPQVPLTHRYIDLLAGPGFSHIGGMNQHGVGIAETTLTCTRPELANPHGLLAPFSVRPERSLMTLALQRARSAREAVRIIGALAEDYGYHSSFPIDGEQLAISDGAEVWTMEIFGPGPDWTTDSGEPGAVWCAQRVPDGHVGISANRSRIGEIDLADPDRFLASPNAVSLAEAMGWWDSEIGDPFIWSDAYAPGDCRPCVIREWRAFDVVAPSLRLSPDDPLPFSVVPDRPLSTPDVMAIQRDLLEGTEFDVTADPAFLVDGALSSLACPMCRRPLYELAGVSPERTINNARSSFSCLYQTRTDQPPEVRGCAWFGFGPAATTCYVPIYSGVTRLPCEWGSTEVATADLSLPFWTMILPGYLAAGQWQDAYPEIRAVRDPAEEAFMSEQSLLPAVLAQMGEEGADIAQYLNEYTRDRLLAVEAAFGDLATRLLVDHYAALGSFVSGPISAVELPEFP
jgi:dipeptidase